MRQLYDMKAGARAGEWTNLMKPVVATLSEEDLLNIAAYVSSRVPYGFLPQTIKASICCGRSAVGRSATGNLTKERWCVRLLPALPKIALGWTEMGVYFQVPESQN